MCSENRSRSPDGNGAKTYGAGQGGTYSCSFSARGRPFSNMSPAAETEIRNRQGTRKIGYQAGFEDITNLLRSSGSVRCHHHEMLKRRL